MSAPKDTQANANAAVVEDDEIPGLEDAGKDDAGDVTQGGKQAKRYAKAMSKLGLKPEPGVNRVQIKKNKGFNFSIAKPEVYRFPGTNTFVIFGETQMEDLSSDAQRAARVAAAAQPATDAAVPAAAAAPAADAADEAEEDPAGIQQKEIDIVMAQASVSRNRAIRALKNNKGDIVNAIMELTM